MKVHLTVVVCRGGPFRWERTAKGPWSTYGTGIEGCQRRESTMTKSELGVAYNSKGVAYEGMGVA